MASLIANFSGLLSGFLGLLVSIYPPTTPMERDLTVVVFVVLIGIGAIAAVLQHRAESREAKALLREVTGEGGVPVIHAMGAMAIDGQVRNGKCQVLFRMTSGSIGPVFDSKVSIMQFVGVGNGTNGTDMIILPTASVAAIHPNSAPEDLFADWLLFADRVNIFTGVVFSRSGTFSQYIVCKLLPDKSWHCDTEVVRLVAKGNAQERQLVRVMNAELRKELPEVWREPLRQT